MNHTIGTQLFTVQFSDMQITGSRHPHCQDVTFFQQQQDLLFAGIADGKTDAPYGAEGGYAALQAVADHIAKAGLDAFLAAPFPDVLPGSVTAVFRKTLQDLAAARQASFQDFASTLLLLTLDLKTGRYLSVHLGSGCVLGVSPSEEIGFISPPEYGLTVYHTWLTTSHNAISHLRLSSGSIERKKRILLLSNGADCLCRHGSVPLRARSAIAQNSPEALHSRLAQSTPEDDASCVLLDFFPKVQN